MARLTISEARPACAPQVVYAVTLEAGRLRSVVWSYGATLVELWAEDRFGQSANVVLRLATLADYQQREDDTRLGSTVGRFCRLVAGGRFDLDGVNYELDRNADGHHLHGGTFGFDRRSWVILDHQADDTAAQVTLGLVSPDGDQGYPGQLRALTTYRLSIDSALSVTYEATTSAPTIVGMTTHGYWNLAGDGTVDEHELSINADAMLACGPDLLPLAETVTVVGGPYDFRSPQTIGTARLDDCFLTSGRQPVAQLRDPRSGRSMTICSDQPGLAVYTADKFRRGRRRGVCLQSTALTDAPNRPEFPSVVLRPGETYKHTTRYSFSAQ